MLNVTSMIGGGAGISAVAFPSISGERFRFRADLGITKDGSNLVSNWADQSGNGDDIAEATNKPLYVANLVNGQPAIRFDGSNDVLSNSSVTGFGDTHIYMVINQVSWTSGRYICRLRKSGDSHSIQQLSSTPRIQHGGDALDTNECIPPSLGTFFLLNSRHDGATTSFNQINNDTAVTGGDPGSVNSGLTLIFLGANHTPAAFSNIEVAEWVIYADAGTITGSDDTALKNYFNARYALY